MLAGILLFLPGFLTDLVGAVLLIGPVRRWCGRGLSPMAMRPAARGDRAVIDLAPDEWQQVPDRGSSRGGDKPRRR